MPVDTPREAAAFAAPGHLTETHLSAVPARQAVEAGPSYYDVSLLAAPVWKWEISTYFFLGGVAAGSFLLARLAERFGGRRYRAVTRAGTAVAAAAVVPCAPLLIKDLGDPKRFHHMLRVFKPHSPMNLGTWVMTSFSGVAALALLREWRRGDRTEEELSATERVLDAVVVAVCDVAGVPLALVMACYTGVLLTSTSTPVWRQNPWLPAAFTASAVGNGAAAISLALSATGAGDEDTEEALHAIDSAAHAAEAATLAGYVTQAGGLAKPLTHGASAPQFWGGVLGLAASELLKRSAPPGPAGRWRRAASALAGLAGGYALRWAFVHAGKHSADDPEAARQASGPK
jgi:formate-dependent nitrite reductase membrane component NrfD